MPKPKQISPSDVDHTLGLAVQYRMCGNGAVAESMCLDVLAVEADNQAALEELLHVYAGRITQGIRTALADARGVLERLSDPVTHAFCSGLIYEVQARRLVARHDLPAAEAAQELFGFAVEQFEQAADTAENPLESRLRANACLRAMTAIRRNSQGPEQQQEQAIE